MTYHKLSYIINIGVPRMVIMEDKRIKVLGIGIIGFLALFLLIYVGKSQLEESYKLLPGDVETEKLEHDYDSWSEYTSTLNNFRAQFPTQPQVDSKKTSVPGDDDKEAALDVYVSAMPDGSFLMIQVLRYPPDHSVTDVDRALRSVMGHMINLNPNNILRNDHETKFQDQPALNYTIENPESRIEGTSIYANNAIYTLIYAAKPQVYEPDVFEHFTRQFVITTDFQSPPSL